LHSKLDIKIIIDIRFRVEGRLCCFCYLLCRHMASSQWKYTLHFS